jgi:hypothetical protein
MPERDDEDRRIIGDLVRGSMPFGHEPFVTHEQMGRALTDLERRIEVRLENAMLRTRNWVLGGVLATAILFGGGFITLVNKIDRMAEAIPRIATIQENRGVWMQQQGQRDAVQDRTLQKLDKDYEPVPFEAVPR